MYNVLRNVLLYLWVSSNGAIGSAQTTSDQNTNSVPNTGHSKVTDSTAPALSTTASISSNATGTCSSRTINYITQTLARQCLRTDRVHSGGSATQNGTDDEVPLTTSLESTSAGVTPPATTTQTIVVTSTIGAKTPNPETSSEASQAQQEPVPAAAPTSSSIVDVGPSSLSEDETDSPLDNSNFLSFEDWKKQNLAKSGQSPDDIGRAQHVDNTRSRPINNALDSLGDEQEINIDFAGFGGASRSSVPTDISATPNPSQSSHDAHSGSLRSKDAGKTCKERTNYASFDCAATILKSNKECKHASSVLVENKDSYMLNQCSASNKFFIVELCNDIQIDTIVLANYEFFSSGFRHFRVSVSDRYPVKMEKWKDLGTFEARNTREIQAFLVENPQIWARYLRIEFLTQYGTEYYCPVSLLRVHGITMMEDYRHQEELARGEVEDVTLEPEAIAEPVIKQEPSESTDETLKATAQAIPSVDIEPEDRPREIPSKADPTATTALAENTPSSASPTRTASVTSTYSNGTIEMQVGMYEPNNVNMTCNTTPGSAHSPTGPATVTSHASVVSTSTTESANSTTPPQDSSAPAGSTSASDSPQSTIDSDAPSSAIPCDNSNTSPAVASINGTSTILSASSTPSAAAPNATSEQISASVNSTRASTPSANTPPAPQPSTQESFFKSVTKRLSQLESNSTLSLQYIEEQSRILRDAFGKVEKRQIAKTSEFLTQLNNTVMVELHGFRQAYDQLWQSTVIELEGQRETYQREMLALSTRLTIVADELVWQKRMSIMQSTVLLICLALAIFGRSGNGALEMPLVEQILSRTAAFRAGFESPPGSPGPHSRSPVSLFRRKIWRSSTDPGDVKYAARTEESSQVQAQDHHQPIAKGFDGTADTPARPPTSNGELEDEQRHSRVSIDGEKPTSGESSAPSSPGRKKKKPKKPPNWPHGSSAHRAKSPLATDGY